MYSKGIVTLKRVEMQTETPLSERVRKQLLDGALDLISRSRSPYAHVHQCATCPDSIICNRPPDQCGVPSGWICVGCGLDAQDQWMDEHEQEPR